MVTEKGPDIAQPRVNEAQTPAASLMKLPTLMKAVEALNTLSVVVGGPSAAANLIINEVYQGHLRAFALSQWEASGANLSLIWKAGPPSNALRRGEVARKLLRPSARLIEDAKDWNWKTGKFFVTKRTRPTTRHMMTAVRFASDDIRALAKTYGAKTGRGGRPPKLDAWGEVWMELVRMAHAGDLSKARQVNRGAFNREVFQRLNWDKEESPPLAEDTINPVTGVVWDQIIEPKARS